MEIAPGVEHTEWIDLRLTPDSSKPEWEQGVEMFRKRINERYLEPIRVLIESKDIIEGTNKVVSDYSGFAIVSLECLLIETLYSFRTGRRNDYDKLSKTAFREFLTQQDPFRSDFTSTAMAEIFYEDFRCGILHQGEVKNSGRIWRVGPLVQLSVDGNSLIINRTKLYYALKQYLGDSENADSQGGTSYQQELLDGIDRKLRENFIKKMDEICRYVRRYMLIFGFGSLMWDGWEKRFDGRRFERAKLVGYHRAFNKKSIKNWGTRETPGPTLGLEQQEGSECVGTAFEIGDDRREEVIDYLKKREGSSFKLTEKPVLLEDERTVLAIVPINKHNHTYIGNVSIEERVQMACIAAGDDGGCKDYIDGIYTKLKELGIEDIHVQQMWNAVQLLQSQDQKDTP